MMCFVIISILGIKACMYHFKWVVKYLINKFVHCRNYSSEEAFVKDSEKIKRGDIIGCVGNPGLCNNLIEIRIFSKFCRYKCIFVRQKTRMEKNGGW